MKGTNKTRPGPLTFWKRPRVNTTARSYSRRMRTEAIRQTAATKQTRGTTKVSIENMINGPSRISLSDVSMKRVNRRVRAAGASPSLTQKPCFGLDALTDSDSTHAIAEYGDFPARRPLARSPRHDA